MRALQAACLGLMLCIAAQANAQGIFAPTDTVVGGARVGSNFVVGVVGTAAGVNNWPNGENPTKVVDGVGQKYLNFAELDSGLIITPGLGATTAKSLQIWTANDAEARDPASFELYGTNSSVGGAGPFSLASFTLISSGPLALPTTRNGGGTAALDVANSKTISFVANANAYTSYLLLFPTVKNSTSANSMQIAEAQLYTVPEPSMALSMVLAMIPVFGRLRRRS